MSTSPPKVGVWYEHNGSKVRVTEVKDNGSVWWVDSFGFQGATDKDNWASSYGSNPSE